MNSRRLTPQSKMPPKGPPSASRFRSPTVLNSTLLERRDSASRMQRSGSASRPLRSSSYMDLSCIGPNSSVHPNFPNIKRNVLDATPLVDYELECDFGYNDYLQALMKREITGNTIHKYEEEINDQLLIQKDNLYQGKLTLKKYKQAIEELEKLEEVEKLMAILSNNFAQFSQLCENFNFRESLEQLLTLLQTLCNRINVKNVKSLNGPEDLDKLNVVSHQCLEVLQRMNLKDRNVEEVNNLADVMTEYKENLQLVTQKQEFIYNAKDNETYKLFKSISDMYAEREKYLLK